MDDLNGVARAATLFMISRPPALPGARNGGRIAMASYTP